MTGSLNSWQMLGLILASAMLWMHYVQSKDRHQPEPRQRSLIAFGLGIVACGLSVLGFHALDALGVPDIKFGEAPWTGFYCFMFIGPLEEGAKVLLAYLFVFRWREYDEPMDGFIYAAALSLGFASAENFYNVPELDWPQQLARTVALPLTHVLFSAIWGFGLGYAHFRVSGRARRACWQISSIVLGMFAHGLYDFLLLAYQATFVTSGLALALWVFVIWRVRVHTKEAVARDAVPVRAGPATPTNQP